MEGECGAPGKAASKIRARKILDSAKQLDSLLFFSSHEYERFLSAIPSTSLVSQVESPFNSVAWILLDLSVRSREPFLARGARGSSLDPRHFSSWPPSQFSSQRGSMALSFLIGPRINPLQVSRPSPALPGRDDLFEKRWLAASPTVKEGDKQDGGKVRRKGRGGLRGLN